VGIKEYEERLVPQEAHLLNGLQLIHREYPECLSANDQRRKSIGIVFGSRGVGDFGGRLTRAAPSIMATLVLLDLLAEHVNTGVEGDEHLAGAFLRPKRKALPASSDLGNIAITRLSRRGMMRKFDVDLLYRRQVVIQPPRPFIHVLFDLI
jgi:hypothetical protein